MQLPKPTKKIFYFNYNLEFSDHISYHNIILKYPIYLPEVHELKVLIGEDKYNNMLYKLTVMGKSKELIKEIRKYRNHTLGKSKFFLKLRFRINSIKKHPNILSPVNIIRIGLSRKGPSLDDTLDYESYMYKNFKNLYDNSKLITENILNNIFIWEKNEHIIIDQYSKLVFYWNKYVL